MYVYMLRCMNCTRFWLLPVNKTRRYEQIPHWGPLNELHTNIFCQHFNETNIEKYSKGFTCIIFFLLPNLLAVGKSPHWVYSGRALNGDERGRFKKNNLMKREKYTGKMVTSRIPETCSHLRRILRGIKIHPLIMA